MPRRRVACEDAPDGVRSASGAGVGTVVGVTTSFTARQLSDAGATSTVPDLTTLPGPARRLTQPNGTPHSRTTLA